MNQMETHVKVLAIIHIVFGAIFILIGLAAFLLFGGVAGLVHMDNDPDAAMVAPFIGSLGGIVFMFFTVLSIPSIVAGIGLFSFRSWARILTIVLSVLEIANFPFGTAAGAYGLWVLLSKEGAGLFEQSGQASVQY